NSLIAGKLVGTLGSIGGAGKNGYPGHFAVAHPVAPGWGFVWEGAQFATNAHGRVLPPLSGRAFDDEVDQPGDEPLGYAHRRGTRDLEAQSARGPGRLGVEVPHDLHVVGDEPDRGEHHLRVPRRREIGQVVVDVGLEPWRRRRPRPRAVREGGGDVRTFRPEFAVDDGADVLVLFSVAGAGHLRGFLHRGGNGVGDVGDVR